MGLWWSVLFNAHGVQIYTNPIHIDLSVWPVSLFLWDVYRYIPCLFLTQFVQTEEKMDINWEMEPGGTVSVKGISHYEL